MNNKRFFLGNCMAHANIVVDTHNRDGGSRFFDDGTLAADSRAEYSVADRQAVVNLMNDRALNYPRAVDAADAIVDEVMVADAAFNYNFSAGISIFDPPKFADVVKRAREIISRATVANLTIDKGNVVDLLADNMASIPLAELRNVAAACGFAVRS